MESSAYLSGGSGKPKEQINNTPHLYRYAHDTHNGIQVTSVIVIPVPFEIYQISRTRIKAKHFHLIICNVAIIVQRCKYKTYFA